MVKNPKFVHFGDKSRSAVTNCRTSLVARKHIFACASVLSRITLTRVDHKHIIARAFVPSYTIIGHVSCKHIFACASVPP